MHPRRTSAALGAALALSATGFVVLPGLTAASYAAPPTTPYISEIHYDNTGTDTGEVVEVHLPAGTSSAGLSVVLYNGNGGITYDTDALPAVTAGSGPAVAYVEYASNGMQNGGNETTDTDGIALVDGSTVLEFISYEGSFAATDGPAAGMTSTDIGVSEPTSTPVGQSLSRSYDATVGRLVWWGPADSSKGAVNPAPPADEPEPEPVALCDTAETHQIGQVQGEGAATPLPSGTPVTVQGVVVGDVPGFSGYYLQDVDGDGDPATSDGIFVFDDLAVDLGDTVTVTGTPSEFGNQTQINANSSGSASEVCAEGTPADLPDAAPLDLPAGDAEREKLEGMLVEPVDTLTVSEVFDLTSFGELTLSEGGMLVQPTEQAHPGSAGALEIAQQNKLRRITLDDGRTTRVSTTTRPYLSPATPVRVGDDVTFTEPVVLGYGFSQWRLQPADGTAEGVFRPQNTRPSAPEDVHGDIQVGAFNVLNYFLTWSGSNARGARNAEQFQKQADKIVPAIQALRAEVVTLMEIEDTDASGRNPGNADVALADLVQRLNEDAGREKWAYVPLPERLYTVKRDVIRSGIIYQPAWVHPVGASVGLVDETVWGNAREPIAQTFTAEGDKFTVVANHFKSKSPGSPTGDNVDTGDGQGEWNGDRVRQSKSLIAFTKRLVRESGDRDLLLMGDFNAYTMEDPIQVLRDGGFVDLGAEFDPGRYSYVFDDMSGSLDHALASRPLFSKVTGVTHWNINAVESFAYQYTGDPALYAPHPYRSSDHDPLVLGLELQAPTTCLGVEATVVGTRGDDVLEGTNGRDVFVAGAGDDEVLGSGGADLVCAGGGSDVVRSGAGPDEIHGQQGHDELRGGGGDDELYGDAGDDTLLGQRGFDTLHGGPGNDTLRPGVQ
jgi:predicted extracellular nuclease